MSIQTQRKTQEKHQCPKKEPVLDAMEDFGYLTQQLPKRKTHKKPGASKVTHNLQLFILCNLHTKELKQSKIHQKRNGRFNHWPCLNSIIDVRNDSDALWTYQSSDLRVFSWATDYQVIIQLHYGYIGYHTSWFQLKVTIGYKLIGYMLCI